MNDVLNPFLGEALGKEEGGTLPRLQHVAEEEQLVGAMTRLLCLVTELSNEWAEFCETAFKVWCRVSGMECGHNIKLVCRYEAIQWYNLKTIICQRKSAALDGDLKALYDREMVY